MKNTIFLTLIFVSSHLFCQIDTANYVFRVVEHMPEFPGGERVLTTFIQQNLHYPKSAKENKEEGRVVVTFVIDTNGSIENPIVLKKISPDIDLEALRIVRSLPKFKPGMNREKKVKVMYSLPINFYLNAPPTYVKTIDTIPHPVEVSSETAKDYTAAAFIGGYDALINFINGQNRYPAATTDAKQYVIIQVIISSSGQVINPQLKVAQVSGQVNSEALRIVRNLPDFVPATRDGKPIDSFYIIPVPFKR
jgi:TonB family protein